MHVEYICGKVIQDRREILPLSLSLFVSLFLSVLRYYYNFCSALCANLGSRRPSHQTLLNSEVLVLCPNKLFTDCKNHVLFSRSLIEVIVLQPKSLKYICYVAL